MHDFDKEINELSKVILDTCFYIHTKLGPGLLESVYEECLFELLTQKGVRTQRQLQLPIHLDSIVIKSGLRLDLLIEDQIVVELKACEKHIPLYEAQLHTYLKLSGKPLGLLINFNVRSLKDGIKRIAVTQNK